MDGISYGDYVEQITYLLFLKLAEGREDPGYDNPSPGDYQWPELVKHSGGDLEWNGAKWTIRMDRPEGWRGGAN